jgi:hypothetical protein
LKQNEATNILFSDSNEHQPRDRAKGTPKLVSIIAVC